MKKLFFWLCYFALVLAAPACRESLYPNAPGTLFIRQQICDLSDFKTRFFAPKNDLKNRGFLTYRFYRDIGDPKTYILVFECVDLKKAVEFIQSSNFILSCVGAGIGLPVIWAGTEELPAPQPVAGRESLVLVRYEVKDYESWKKRRDRGDAGLYRLSGSPGVVIAAQKVGDIQKARDRMESPGEKDVMSAAGVTHLDIWFGIYLEDGTKMDGGS
jgi:hypothetical protein